MVSAPRRPGAVDPHPHRPRSDSGPPCETPDRRRSTPRRFRPGMAAGGRRARAAFAARVGRVGGSRAARGRTTKLDHHPRSGAGRPGGGGREQTAGGGALPSPRPATSPPWRRTFMSLMKRVDQARQAYRRGDRAAASAAHDPGRIERAAQEEHGGAGDQYLGDLVYGGLDGVVTTFAVVSGVVGASLGSDVILILGLANLLADGF